MSRQASKPPPWTDAAREFAMKESQSLAGRVIAGMLGPFTKSNPQLWSQRKFLLLLTKIYEQLVIDRKELTPKDFLEWARTLREAAKSGQSKGSRQKIWVGNSDCSNDDTPVLAGKLESIVREIYGANLHIAHDKRGKPAGEESDSSIRSD